MIKVYAKGIFSALIICFIHSCNSEINNLDQRCQQNPKFIEEFELPNGLIGYNNYESALECSKITRKPLAIYFDGFACVNCRKFEDNFLSKKDIIKKLNENFIFVSLKVDDKRVLPKANQIFVETLTGRKRKLKNIGHMNAHIQTNIFQLSSQPTLVLRDMQTEEWSYIGYNPNHEELMFQFEEIIKKYQTGEL